jgi:hypothetical protein
MPHMLSHKVHLLQASVMDGGMTQLTLTGLDWRSIVNDGSPATVRQRPQPRRARISRPASLDHMISPDLHPLPLPPWTDSHTADSYSGALFPTQHSHSRYRFSFVFL